MKKKTLPVTSIVAMLFLNLTLANSTVGVPINITEQMLFADDPKDWLTVERVLQPVFPPAMLATGATGYVDLAITINGYGSVEKIGTVVSKPENAAFEQSARDSVKHWKFRPAVASNCTPQTAEGNVRVWFEIRDGKEMVSISSLPRGTEKTAPNETIPNRIKMLNYDEVKSSVRFPDKARNEGAQANVYGVMDVAASSGLVNGVEISHVLSTSRLNEPRREFKNEVINALNSARFEPVANPAKTSYKVCMVFHFRLQNHALP